MIGWAFSSCETPTGFSGGVGARNAFCGCFWVSGPFWARAASITTMLA